MTEWTLTGVLDVLADAVPDRELLVRDGVRRTYGEVAERSRALGGFLAERGVGVRRERDGLARWECGQVPVALILHNRPEYLEAMYGCFRARAVPFNVNHQYTRDEVRALLAMVGAGAVVYERAFGPLVAAAAEPGAVLIDVDDGSGVEPLPGSTAYEDAVRAGRGSPLPTPSPDDLYLVCTGGTTGSPKAVLWRQADIIVAAMAGAEDATTESIAAATLNPAEIWFPAPPFMHAAAQWTAFSGIHLGATIVMHDDSRRFDAGAILRVIERERVTLISIVGDAYARPLVEELRRGTHDVSSLVRIGTGGAMTSAEHKAALFDLIPGVMIVDGYGASETGGMAYGAATKEVAFSTAHAPAGGGLVLSEDRSRVLEPGDGEVGWIARRGRVPLGYLGDRRATETTFPEVDGERFAVPGDRGQVEADGSIRVLGRDSMVVNTGGEKVFVEEVEQALLTHPAVEDAVVVGRPSERFGNEVVAVVQLAEGAEADAVDLAALRDHCAGSIARFKAPRAVVFVDAVQRHPTGKADYRWARAVAAEATPVPAT